MQVGKVLSSDSLFLFVLYKSTMACRFSRRDQGKYQRNLIHFQQYDLRRSEIVRTGCRALNVVQSGAADEVAYRRLGV